MKTIILSTLFFVVGISTGSVFSQESDPDRIISVDTTIGAGTDTITGNIIVPENVTLTLLPGAVLYFKGDTCASCSRMIVVKGNIIAKGTNTNPVIFTSDNSVPVQNRFKGISIEKPYQSNDTVVFDHCIFEKSSFFGYSNGTIAVNSFSIVQFTDCIIRNNNNIGVYNEGHVSIQNTSVSGGSFFGIKNHGTAHIEACSVFNNYGGGIFNSGYIGVRNSTLFHNQARSGSNGADGLPGRCDCYSSMNGTNGLNGGNGENGGGIQNEGTAEIFNSTITWNYSGNYGKGGSGGRATQGTCTKVDPITHQVTTTYCIAGAGSNGMNGSYGKGGGIYNTGVLKLKNSIIAHNMKCDYSGDDIYGTINSSSRNIISDQSGAVFTGESAGNQFVDPLVDVLQFNGGSTPTCALQLGSPAVDALSTGISDIPAVDQRGFARLNTPDIGSFEFTGCTLSELKGTWNPHPVGQSSAVFDISAVNDSVVWVRDVYGDSLSISVNGGVSWITRPFPVFEGYPRSAGGICALSKTTAFYIQSASDSKGIYKTTDGGVTWRKQTSGFSKNSPFPDVIHFWNENEGVAIGDADPNQNFEIYTTTNGGELWNRVADGNMPNGNKEATINSQSSYRVVGNSFYFITNTARIFKSPDKGITWSVVNTPFFNTSLATANITFDFEDDNNGLVSYLSADKSDYKMYKTSDGGQKWDLLQSCNFYDEIKYIPNLHAYFSMNQNGGLSYSCDNGQTWISVGNLNSVKLFSASYGPTGKIFLGGLGTMYISAHTMTISANTLTIGAPANSSKIVTITSNTKWTVQCDQNWLSVSNPSGSNNAVITLMASANPATTTRTAIITISGDGVPAQTITVIQESGLNSQILETQDAEFSVYPNPSNSTLFITGLKDNSKISIVTLSGRIVMVRQIKNHQIDIRSLEKGVYILKTVEKTGAASKKFVKL